MDKELIKAYRLFLKDSIRKVIDFTETDQNRGINPPPIEKDYPKLAKLIDLVEYGQLKNIKRIDLKTAINNRESRRSYSNQPLSIEELSFLLWATQGIKQKLDAGHALRTVPSAGCRHSLETYLCVLRVHDLNQGIYRYLPLEHKLLYEFTEDNLGTKMSQAVFVKATPKTRQLHLYGLPFPTEWNGAMTLPRIRLLPLTSVMSVRIFTLPVKLSNPVPVLWPRMIRKKWMPCSELTDRMNLQYTLPQ